MMKYLRLLLVSLSNATGFADNASLPGEVTTPFPAITNLDVEWQIEGDDDLRLANLSISCRVCAAERNTPMRIRLKPWCVALRCTHPVYRSRRLTNWPAVDDDLDAVYGVRFRIEGTQQWQIGLEQERPVSGPRP